MKSEKLKKKDSVQSYETLKKISHQMVILRNVAKLFSDQHSSLDDTMFPFIHMILEGFRNPEVIGSRVKIFDSIYETDDFSKFSKTIRKSITPYDDEDVFIEIGFSDSEKSKIIEEDENAFFSTIILDLQSYLERQRLKVIQKRTTKELELFASLMRHDLKNDIGLILTNIELTKMSIPEEFSELKEHTAISEAICERMIKLLSILGKEAKSTETHIAKIIMESIERTSKIHPNLQISKNFNELENVETIPNRLLPLVFDNLFRNTAKHAGPEVMITINGKLMNDVISIDIQDNGPGVASSVKDRLFERGTSTTGGGYGLYLSREVLRIIGGSIRLKDTPNGTGACFTITLPVRKM